MDVHFIHVRSKHEDAMPLIVTHGWPGSPIEQLKIIDPLTNPTAHGASASDLQAVLYLAEGRSVTTVAFDVGYASQSAFTYMFRCSLGVAPRHYFRKAE